jgi:phosphoglycolate phosphatase
VTIPSTPEPPKNAGVAFAAVTTGTTTSQEFARLPHVAIMKDLSEILTIP